MLSAVLRLTATGGLEADLGAKHHDPNENYFLKHSFRLKERRKFGYFRSLYSTLENNLGEQS
jgi:hypothetical protein